jgi:hypothetical protein
MLLTQIMARARPQHGRAAACRHAAVLLQARRSGKEEEPNAAAISPISAGQIGDRGYFIAVLIATNLLLRRVVPMVFTAVMIARAMPAAMRPYSIAVAPFSSARKDLSKGIANSCSSDPT